MPLYCPYFEALRMDPFNSIDEYPRTTPKYLHVTLRCTVHALSCGIQFSITGKGIFEVSTDTCTFEVSTDTCTFEVSTDAVFLSMAFFGSQRQHNSFYTGSYTLAVSFHPSRSFDSVSTVPLHCYVKISLSISWPGLS